ncbi:MAG: long-chain fatty acid--CoA ligase [Magnetospirillum sp.]|nr:long-chain fatty acid--CoA ligase [Magnetospirillum sp.]
MSTPPTDFDNCPSLVRAFFDQARTRSNQPFLWAKRDGEWRALTWAETERQVRALACALTALGVARGDRVALIAENRPEWVIADLAIMAAGAVSVPTYTTNTLDDHLFILSNVQAKGVIVSTRALAETAIAAARRTPSPCAFAIAIEKPDFKQDPGLALLSWDEALAKGQAAPDAVDATVSSLTRADLACVIHTSGTGGKPKGVMLHHGAILRNCAGAWDVFTTLDPGEETYLSFLPLSHSYEHTVCMGFMIGIGAQIYFAEGIDKLGSNMIETRPTIMTAVPRLYESLYARITQGLKREKPLKRMLFAKTLELGTKRYEGVPLGLGERLLDALLERLVRAKVRARFGGRLKAFVSGGAALVPEIGVFFQALGVRVLQGYGQTESGPVISANRPGLERMDTVGPPLKGVEVRIAADGEILVRGELVMKGYWNEPEWTAKTVIDGWLHTGDVGEIDAKGRIKITDRKKDFIKNSGGEMLSPSKIEGALLMEPEIAQAMVHGDKRPYLVAVIVPKPETVEAIAKAKGAAPDLAALADAPELRVAIEAAVERANAKLALPELVRRFLIATQGFTIENEQMTPTLKVRRHVVRGVYGDRLEALYG